MASKPRRRLIVSSNNPSVFSGPTIVNGGAITQQVFGSGSKGGFERLLEASAASAFHDSEQRSDPPKCHPNTRVAILQRITDWVLGANADAEARQAFMMWLYGSAGAGKYAIAQTLAEQFDDGGCLLASFFFSRTDPTRNHALHLVATIAYQMALHIPKTKDLIVAAVEHDPLIFSKSLETQVASLIFEPLQSFTSSNYPNSGSTYLIILDGLDECVDIEAQGKLLRLLMNARRHDWIPPTLRFLISSRPELDIRTVIDSQAFETRPYRLALDAGYSLDSDIQCFFQDKFQELKLYHPHRVYIPSEWPSHDVILDLVRRSSGQFIYASTVVKYVSSTTHMPRNRLDVILGLRPSQTDAPFAALDKLYTYIFATANDLPTVLEVLSHILLDPFFRNVEGLETNLRLQPGVIEVLLSTLGSIVSVKTSAMGSMIKILHASLGDFLFDESRSKELYIYPAAKHAEYAHLFFEHLKDTLDQAYVLHRLIYHLKTALPTPKLHKDITQISLDLLYRGGWKEWREMRNTSDALMAYPFNDFFIESVDPILSSIKALDWKDAAELHDLQQRNFDQMLVDRLAKYYARPMLVFAVSVIALTELSQLSTATFLFRNQSYLFDPVAIEIDRNALCILASSGHQPFNKYYLYLSQFLRDSTRCGLYSVTDQRYAEAALYLYRFTCQGAKYWYYGRIPEHLGIIATLFDRAGKSALLLDEITLRHSEFRSGIEALGKIQSAPVEEKLAEAAIANFIGRMASN